MQLLLGNTLGIHGVNGGAEVGHDARELGLELGVDGHLLVSKRARVVLGNLKGLQRARYVRIEGLDFVDAQQGTIRS